MSTESVKVNLSDFDRGVSIFTAVNSYKTAKNTKEILKQSKITNQHLGNLNRQMAQATAINREILRRQIEAEEYKVEQKFYKALSFNLNEMIDRASAISDPIVVNYFIANFYDKMKTNILEANDKLDEIADKSYAKQVLDKLNKLKTQSAGTIEAFSSSVLGKIDQYVKDFKTEQEQAKPLEFTEVKAKNSTNRILGIAFCLIIILGLLFDNSETSLKGSTFIIGFVLVVTWLFFLIKAEYKHRKNNVLIEEKQKEFEINRRELEVKKEQQLKNFESQLAKKMEEINTQYPTFSNSIFEITGIEQAFEKKWGL
jgi:hypothetical protein